MNPRSRAKAGDAEERTQAREPNDFTQDYCRTVSLHEGSRLWGRKSLSNPHERSRAFRRASSKFGEVMRG